MLIIYVQYILDCVIKYFLILSREYYINKNDAEAIVYFKSRIDLKQRMTWYHLKDTCTVLLNYCKEVHLSYGTGQFKCLKRCVAECLHSSRSTCFH